MEERPEAKDLLIHRTPLVKFDGKSSCRTVLYHVGDDQYEIGRDAEIIATQSEDIPHLNRDFKVALGHASRSVMKAERFPCADGEERGARTLAGQFLRKMLTITSKQLEADGVKETAHLILAEPISFRSEEEGNTWLSNYRKALTDLLKDREYTDIENIRFAEVEFLPEPFAVFNYYKYGFRHPHISGSEQYRVLVVDSGGGTTDCSVIETTQSGDISRGGKNAVPFGASSKPIGGYFVDHHIVRRVFEKNFANDPIHGKRVSRALRKCLARMRGESEEEFDDEMDSFFENYLWVLHYAERAKCKLSKRLEETNLWTVEQPGLEEWIHIPEDPFTPYWGDTKVPFSASEFRESYDLDVWRPHLKKLIEQTLQNARPKLEGRPINRVIFSGGSANIGWLKEWISKLEDLRGVQVIDVKEDYQEIVARGLAIECARRFFSDEHQSDFQSVTYNPLSLTLGFGVEKAKPKKLVPDPSSGLRSCDLEPGVVIEAATDLKTLIDKELRWKVDGKHPAPKQVEYFFYSSAVEDLPSGRLNFEEQTIDSGMKSGFDKNITLRISFSEDGTARPSFVFRSATTHSQEHSKSLQPFAIDMTQSKMISTSAIKAYAGVDFGSSNSSVAYITSSAIQEYKHQVSVPSWKELAQIPSLLPQPLAVPFALYLSESHDPLKRSKRARQAIENAVAFMIPILRHAKGVNEVQKYGKSEHKLLKQLLQTKVSAGPLWSLVRGFVETKKCESDLAQPLLDLFKSPERYNVVNDAIVSISAIKHDKAKEETIDWNASLIVLGNTFAEVFERCSYGCFQDYSRKARRHVALFRPLFGESCGQAPFPVKLSGPIDTEEPYIVQEESGAVFPLFPWILLRDATDSDKRKHYFFDGPNGDGFSFKCPGYPEEILISMGGDSDFDAYFEDVIEFLNGDYCFEKITSIPTEP